MAGTRAGTPSFFSDWRGGRELYQRFNRESRSVLLNWTGLRR
jgi:hypothetical protein